eukprot:COSAG02_NODE_15455_length_1169_cov_3.822555_2_plen_98_part_01
MDPPPRLGIAFVLDTPVFVLLLTQLNQYVCLVASNALALAARRVVIMWKTAAVVEDDAKLPIPKLHNLAVAVAPVLVREQWSPPRAAGRRHEKGTVCT